MKIGSFIRKIVQKFCAILLHGCSHEIEQLEKELYRKETNNDSKPDCVSKHARESKGQSRKRK